ncbi:hypothetical protein [Persephonella sp.]
MDVLDSFIKKLDFEIKKEKRSLQELEEKIVSLRREEQHLKRKYEEIKNSQFDDPLSIHMKSASLLNILKKLKKIQQEAVKLEDEAEKIRVIIKEKNAEKKAIKNYKKKLENEKNIEELKRETQLVDEFFNRKF